jgi:3-hydroxyisobutyrate dehydrogenase-like beta-hydroxyacid dehydrogenase
MIASDNYDPPGFNMLLALKDLTLITDAADEVRVALPMANIVRNNVLTSIGRGMQDMDYAALGRLAIDNAGIKPKK